MDRATWGNSARLPLQASVLRKMRFPEDLGGEGEAESLHLQDPGELKAFFGRWSQATGTLYLPSPHRPGRNAVPPSLRLPLRLLPCSIHHHHAILHLLCLFPWTAHAC